MTGPDSSAAEWFEIETDSEAADESAALGGALSTEGRVAAIGSTLPLLGLYFSSGSQPLEVRAAIGKADTLDPAQSQLLAGIRLRVALAAADRLQAILDRLLSRPTFRYTLTSGESIGALTGALDINRYSTHGVSLGEVPTYPTLEVRRGEQTPENMLAAYSTMWVLRELTAAMADSVALADSPERAAYRVQARALNEALRLPALASCLPGASEINRRAGERQLIDEVRRRLRRREVANASPYIDLLTWIVRCLDGHPAAQPGELDWSFYGDRFDTKLFELWCLRTLAIEVSRQLAVDVPALNLRWRRGGVAFVWDRPAGTLEMYYQRSVPLIAAEHAPRWVQADAKARPLGGVPDIVVKATRRTDGQVRLAILDPKLRQRSGSPTEELYKVIGYLDNYGLTSSPYGAILYHTTSHHSLPSHVYRRQDADGMLYAVALNPAAQEPSRRAMIPIATMLLGLLEIPRLDKGLPSSEATDPELAVEARARARITELHALSTTLPVTILDASRRRVQALLGDGRWQRIPSGVQTMLATSEHVGFSLDSGADFSGPVIGIAASVESAMHDLLITPAVAHDPQLGNGCKTLGQAIYSVRKSLGNGHEPLHDALRRFMNNRRIDLAVVRLLLSDLETMNRSYRIPAAHRDLVADNNWRAAWTLIVGQGQLLARIIDALDPVAIGWPMPPD
ncbi:hypothetical protein ACFTSF_06495 [Kribbella sp. NPDC056951]|uniref:hypothetical protein n=1 Tax=Kribbella sp. NPDC056951 TaxID=3345978 RepID=UPI00363D8EB1